MNVNFVELLNSLNALEDKLSSLNFPQPELLNLEPYTTPFLRSDDLLNFTKRIKDVINRHSDYETNDADNEKIESIKYIIDHSDKNLERLHHGNSGYATPAINAYMISMMYAENLINDIFSFDLLSDKSLLPSPMIRKLSSYQNRIESISGKTESIEQKIKTINDAYNAAESLPMTMSQLDEANEEIRKINQSVADRSAEIDQLNTNAKSNERDIGKTKEKLDSYYENIKSKMSSDLKSYEDEAKNYIAQCEQAFRMTTTKGLAWSFQEKANKLNVSIRLWVLALSVSLTIAGIVGYYRYIALDNFFLREGVSGFQTFLQIMISIFSLLTPLWFSWLATKQISQRFKLAEDYEFKSSISKAYEGYRREALQLEEDFSQRLFSNALTRLEEPPIRFMSNEMHSSPMSEILSSPAIISAIRKGGDGVDAFLEKTGLMKKSKKDSKKDEDSNGVEPDEEEKDEQK